MLLVLLTREGSAGLGSAGSAEGSIAMTVGGSRACVQSHPAHHQHPALLFAIVVKVETSQLQVRSSRGKGRCMYT